jgi:hypothetical protein
MHLPKWLQGMVLPTLMLWVYALAMGVASGMSPAESLSGRADLISRAGLGLILATWVSADAQKRNWPLCYDYGSFVFLAWMVVVPVYLFRTRGARAFLTLLCFVGISVSSTMIATVIFIVRQIVFDKASV